MPGARGPVPKRDNQRRRMNKPEIPTDNAPGAPEVTAPEGDPAWHSVAANWYASLAQSGQAVFYEPSDWQTAYVVAESMSRDLNAQVVGVEKDTGALIMARVPIKGTNLAAYLKAMSVLLVTEGDRRRARIELVRKAQAQGTTPPDVPSLATYRDRLTS